METIENNTNTIETKSNEELLSEIDTQSKATPTQEDIEAGGIKFIEMQVKALSGGVRLQTRNLLHMLTRHGTDENTKRQIRETIERAIIAAFDYGVDVEGKEMPLRSNGRLGKLEIEYAGTMSKLKEVGMLLMAKKMEKVNFDLDKYIKPSDNKGDSSGEETKAEENNEIKTSV